MTSEVLAEVLERIEELENNLQQRFRQVEETLGADRHFFEIFNAGLREHHRKTNPTRWFEKIRTDPELSYPHKKILDFLISEYDHETEDHKEFSVTEIIRKAHLGKNKAKAYLELLEQKGYVRKRSDGYRKFYKIFKN